MGTGSVTARDPTDSEARSRCALARLPLWARDAAIGLPISCGYAPELMAEQVKVREVGPRDGFQNEPEVIPTADKIRLIDMLARTGLRRLEVTSFVRPDVIPQLADAREVLSGIDPPGDIALSVLIPNERGLYNALELRSRFQEVNLFLSASETHNRKNVN